MRNIIIILFVLCLGCKNHTKTQSETLIAPIEVTSYNGRIKPSLKAEEQLLTINKDQFKVYAYDNSYIAHFKKMQFDVTVEIDLSRPDGNSFSQGGITYNF